MKNTLNTFVLDYVKDCPGCTNVDIEISYGASRSMQYWKKHGILDVHAIRCKMDSVVDVINKLAKSGQINKKFLKYSGHAKIFELSIKKSALQVVWDMFK